MSMNVFISARCCCDLYVASINLFGPSNVAISLAVEKIIRKLAAINFIELVALIPFLFQS